MYQIGDYIVHPGQGVCCVEAVEGGDSPVYHLMPTHGRNPMLIKYPVASEANLRPVLSADEAESLIESYPDMELDPFTDRSAVLEEKHFKKVIRHGSCSDVVRIAKTFRSRIDDVEANHKKAPVIYERIYKEARERSVEEFCCALHESEDQITARFQSCAS